MPSPTYTLFRNAILAEQQIVCIYGSCRRELCPVIIGRDKDGAEAVLVWQFGGETGSGQLPSGGAWKCLKLANVRNAATRHGPWHEGGSHQSKQRCVAVVDLDINIHVRQ
jgi:hypothetical protein